MKNNSGKLKGRVSHYGGADEMGPPTVTQYEQQHTGGNSGKFTGADIASIISSAGSTISGVIQGIFQKPDTYNTYVTGVGSDEEKSNTGLYIGIGAGVLILVLVLVLALRK